jgi:putative hydrolase of the HAD superfamily
MKIETVIFDLDETLIEEESSNDVSALEACAIAHRCYGIDAKLMLTALRARSRELWRAGPAVDYCNNIGISSREGLWGAFTGDEPELRIMREWIDGYCIEAWRRALADVGVEDAAMARELAECFRADRKQRHVVFPEARAVLEALRPRVKLAHDHQRCLGHSAREDRRLGSRGLFRFDPGFGRGGIRQAEAGDFPPRNRSPRCR